MLFVVTFANSFEKSSVSELKSMCSFSVIDSYRNTLIIDSDKDISELVLQKPPTFIQSAFRVYNNGKIYTNRYLDSLYECVTHSGVSKDKALIIECCDINSKTEYSAKDIEVYVGLKLEDDGYLVTMRDPTLLLYIILVNMNCYVGYTNYREKLKVDPLRHDRLNHKVSRSELKLRQAIDQFNIKTGGIAMDIGAAPGGWSRLLAKRGYRVVSIDWAEMDSKRLSESGLSVKVIGKDDINGIGDLIYKYDIIHVKTNEYLNFPIHINLITNDTNMHPHESAKLLNRYANILNKDGDAIMTVKCVSRNVDSFIKEAVERMPDFELIAAKVLPSNRQEVTLHLKPNNSGVP